MSEETIMNGIDVSECGFCCWKHNGNELIENYCAVFNNKCICNPQCYFKQLQRLKQENEELKEDLKVYHRPDIIKVLTDYRTGELGLLQEKYNTLTNKFFNSEANNYKFKQALEEIRKNIAKLIAKKGYAETEEDFILAKTIEVLNEK